MSNLFQSLSLLGLGFVLGLQHAADPDHLAAVATVTTRTNSLGQAARLGMFWGLGHTATLLAVGLLVLALRVTIPESLALSFELIVGIMLVILGGNLLRKLGRGTLHRHAHTHAGIEHTHLHSHKHSAEHTHAHLSFFTGLLHGLAGSAALTLLALSTAHSITQGLVFILIFGLGSIFGMIILSNAIAAPLILLQKYRQIPAILMAVSGVISLVIGLTIIVNSGQALGLAPALISGV